MLTFIADGFSRRLPPARRLLVAAIVFSSALSLQGCFLVPIIDGVSKMGITEGDRAALLPQDMKLFQDALYWGRSEEAAGYAIEENRADLARQFRHIRKTERVVESQVESVEFENEGYTANVELLVKYYSVPFYIVNERTEQQTWTFLMPGGWRLVSRSEVVPG